MSTARDRQVLDLWLAVADLPADQRESFLAQYCGADTSLIAEVFALARQRAGGPTPAQPGGLDASASTRPAMPRSLTPGTVLHERYRIVRVVGGGGMGTVYEAVDLRLRNVVAVKQMIAAGGDADRAFEREAGLLASMRHPSIPVVIDYFVDGIGRFLVMQFIDGDDLSLVLQRQRGPCSVEDVLTWAPALLNALEYLHSHVPPIVHRDIKPSNVRRTLRGDLVLLDFGLAKGPIAPSDSSATVEKSVFGYTPAYSPPEQLSGRGTTPQSDLYALGATLYHLATGTPPPNARERASALDARGSDLLVGPQQLNPVLPAGFASAVVQAMALDPIDRFASAAAMRAALLGEPLRVAPKNAPIRERRVDAAIPGYAELGKQIDLMAQVRFGDSPRLGLEDFPGRRRPAEIEQSSETVRVTYPVDSRTGARLPARLHLRLVAPDFTIHGDADRHIEVPPDDYSTRVTFMLSPLRLGWCRLNLDLYGPDALYLGAIPLESEAVAAIASFAEIRVGNLALAVTVAERAEQSPSAPGSIPFAAPLERSAQRSQSVDTDGRRGDDDDTQQVLMARAKPEWGGRRLGVALALVVLLSGITIWRSRPFAPAPHIAQGETPRSDLPAPTSPVAQPPARTAAAEPPPAMKAPAPSFAAPARPVSPPPITSGQQARNDIRQLAASYCASLETLNVRMVQRIVSSADAASLQRRFAQYATLKCSIVEPVEFERLDLSSVVGVARVRFRMRQVVRLRNEGEPRTEESVVTMTVTRTSTTEPWLIDRLQNRPISPR